MSQDKMREEFEAAFAKETAGKASPEKLKVFDEHGGFENLLREGLVDDRCGDTYATNIYASAWWAWQASRAALVIELPDHYGYDNPGEAFHAVKDCREAIEAAGLKVKP